MPLLMSFQDVLSRIFCKQGGKLDYSRSQVSLLTLWITAKLLAIEMVIAKDQYLSLQYFMYFLSI